jgi:hypothetical protein
LRAVVYHYTGLFLIDAGIGPSRHSYWARETAQAKWYDIASGAEWQLWMLYVCLRG